MTYRIVDAATRRSVRTGIPSWEEARKALREARTAHRGGDF